MITVSMPQEEFEARLENRFQEGKTSGYREGLRESPKILLLALRGKWGLISGKAKDELREALELILELQNKAKV